jgi:pyridoxal phosphate enzyme (YggS family)
MARGKITGMSDVAENLRAVRARIAAATRAAGRDPDSVSLLAVSKTWPADAVRELAGLGQLDFGENRAQELLGKAAEVADLPLRWHFVGQLQRNKAAAVARLGAVVHSVDRPSLASALDRAGQERMSREGGPIEVLLQVDLGGRPGGAMARGGAAPADVPALADLVAGAAGLRLRGLMAVAPLEEDPRSAFERLAGVAARVRADHPEAVDLSAGMSGDLEAAVAAGSTIVRVGTALFGDRPLPCDGDQNSPAT